MAAERLIRQARDAFGVTCLLGALGACQHDSQDDKATQPPTSDAASDAAPPSFLIEDAAQRETFPEAATSRDGSPYDANPPDEPDAARTTPSERGDAADLDSGSSDRAEPAELDAASPVFDAGDSSASCPVSLDPDLGEHACWHVSNGPFAAVDAMSEAPLDPLDRTHTLYSVSLPSAASEGALDVRVVQDSLYAIFASSDLPLRLIYQGEELPVVHAQRTRVSCEGVSHVALWELEANLEYQLWLGPGAQTVDLIFERVTPDSLSEACWDQPDASTHPAPSPDPEAGALDAGPDTVLPETSTNDAGTCESDVGTCSNDCTQLGNACLTGEECCSGRCYARQCVLLECRTEGFCERNEECCSYCHHTESPHCH